MPVGSPSALHDAREHRSRTQYGAEREIEARFEHLGTDCHHTFIPPDASGDIGDDAGLVEWGHHAVEVKTGTIFSVLCDELIGGYCICDSVEDDGDLPVSM